MGGLTGQGDYVMPGCATLYCTCKRVLNPRICEIIFCFICCPTPTPRISTVSCVRWERSSTTYMHAYNIALTEINFRDGDRLSHPFRYTGTF